ncbi:MULTISPECIES: hypothetical protein [unclassified Paraburkholderia]|uniref:hypothetical protein n=1 Tax=unclassified Paraburkholderia TaxID=2615204 RepID=UPI00286F3D70|nr:MULTISPECIES: hypothetical protein [unclassified Paraburkholderia]
MSAAERRVQQDPTMHVFEQDNGWHWAITVPREAGSGFRVLTYSEQTYADEAAASKDAAVVLREFEAELAI